MEHNILSYLLECLLEINKITIINDTLDITTVINKAIDNNEKYNVKKDKNGIYIEDKNSIKIEVKMIINNKTYSMENIRKIGMESFTEFFGEVGFKCIDIEYHKQNGKVSKMIFESTEY